MKLFPVLFLFLSAFSRADEIVLSDDGREVRIKDDGSWEFVSDDRFATTREGERIRLKSDGSWEKAPDDQSWVTVPASSGTFSRDRITEGSINLEITEVTIESVRSRQQKNTRLRSQIVTWLSVTSTESQSFSLATGDISLADSRGKTYEIISITPERFEVSPEAPVKVRIIADDSPKWWGVKFFKYEIAPGVLGNAEVLELTRSLNEVQKLDTGALTE